MAKMKETGYVVKSIYPVIEIIGTGRLTYLWVGNKSKLDNGCFATLSGPKRLETLAVNILKALKSKKLKP